MNRSTMLLLLAAAASILPHDLMGQVALIVNPSMKLERISKDDIRDIFTGVASNLPGGPHVRPVMLSKGPVRDEFMATYVGVAEAQFHSMWTGLVFAGKLSMPPSLDSEGEVVSYVREHANAIGFIRVGTAHDGVKVLAVQ